MKLLIELDEEYVKAIDKIKFLVGGRTDRKLQLEIIKAIKNGKALEQDPKKGHWIEEFVDTEGEVRFTCSCCGKYQLFDTDFCYNCGAKMVEPQESEG